MESISQTEVGLHPAAGVPEASHFLQAAAFLRRWRARVRRSPPKPAAESVPDRIDPPARVLRHYRTFAWVIYEQRLVMLVLVFLAGAAGLVWTLALHLEHKAPLVVRAPVSLKEAAVAFYGAPEISYDQVAFFLNGCLPLLYATDDGGHPLLSMTQGLVAPEIYGEAERRLDAAEKDVEANRMTQTLTVTGFSEVVAEAKSGRAAAYVRGYVTVTVRQDHATFFPWRAQALLQANPTSRLNPYPFYLAQLTTKIGPDALAWDKDHGSLLTP